MLRGKANRNQQFKNSQHDSGYGAMENITKREAGVSRPLRFLIELTGYVAGVAAGVAAGAGASAG